MCSSSVGCKPNCCQPKVPPWGSATEPQSSTQPPTPSPRAALPPPQAEPSTYLVASRHGQCWTPRAPGNKDSSSSIGNGSDCRQHRGCHPKNRSTTAASESVPASCWEVKEVKRKDQKKNKTETTVHSAVLQQVRGGMGGLQEPKKKRKNTNKNPTKAQRAGGAPCGAGRGALRRPPQVRAAPGSAAPRPAPPAAAGTPHSSEGRIGEEPERGLIAAERLRRLPAWTDGRTEKWTWVPSTQPRCRQSSPADITACPTATLQPPPECRRCPPAQVPAVRQSAPTAAPPSNDTHLVRLQVQSFPVPSLQLKSLQ